MYNISLRQLVFSYWTMVTLVNIDLLIHRRYVQFLHPFHCLQCYGMNFFNSLVEFPQLTFCYNVMYMFVCRYRSHILGFPWVIIELCVVSAQQPRPVRRRFSTDHSCLGSFIPITPWLGSGTRFLFGIVELLFHMLRQYLSVSNFEFIRSLAIFQGGTFDFSPGTSSNDLNVLNPKQCTLDRVFALRRRFTDRQFWIIP